ncbi:ubiquinone anaerobic biosynthesis accessory factor UbiT [Caldimonas aquatica]|uniref:SCP2 sterol-binding domain-containing protein n=1 Tax=Caldimonas aquatica TaxID=376175 RepID=A0ABY6MU63_9BURK|nr:SCP2 sterol-binding domain-containing protein [Schlegelella aquatica]UZD55546.1 SCP2 sterol-binding domain-containing protein [Schlegelella aquatica]
MSAPFATRAWVEKSMLPRVRAVVSRLPVEPPSWLLAQALNRLLAPRLPEDAREALGERAVEVRVTDLGVVFRLWLHGGRFAPAPRALPVTLRVAADAPTYLRLLRGEEDADRLFFERRLVMEGDTEYGLWLKNTLDALGPLLTWPSR